MAYKAIASPATEQSQPRNSLAANAWLPLGTAIPTCKCCESQMQLFVQFDIEQRFGIPFGAGSHFVLFMCPVCNEIPSFENFSRRILPSDYWERTEGNHYAALYFSEKADTIVEGDSLLSPYELSFIDDAKGLQPKPHIGIGGEPQWVQDEEHFACSCGGKMSFLTQISENFPFPKLPSAPPQPDSFSQDDYCLFLGNEVYVFACENQCNERAIWITVQN